MVKTQKNDFIEIEFLAKIKDTGEIFDTNIEAEAKKAGLEIKAKPMVLSIGKKMILPSLDNQLEDKEIGKQYISEFPPEKAFGKRNTQLIKMISLSQFKNQNIQPQRGMQFNLDGAVAKILSVSGGRVLVDFNNPLAGKTVTYNYKIKRKVDDLKEKINSVQDFFFRKNFNFAISDDKKSLTFKLPEKEKQFEQFIKIMSKPFKDILNLEIKTEIEDETKHKQNIKDKETKNYTTN